MEPESTLVEKCLTTIDQLIDVGDLESARVLCEKVLTLDADNLSVLNLLCLIAFHQGKTRLAINYIDRVIALAGASFELLVNRGILLQKARRFRDAVQTFQSAVQLNPEHPEPYGYLAEINLELGRQDNALAMIERAIAKSAAESESLPHYQQLHTRILEKPALTVSEDFVNNGTFCILPWIHSHFFPSGMATLCCVSANPLQDDNGAPMNIQTHSLEEVWDSTALRNVRKAMLTGKKLNHCSNCYNEEKFSHNSHRLMYNARWLKDGQFSVPDLQALIATQQERPILEKPVSVDYRFGNICNLKCQICNAGNSSQIERDPEHARWNQAPFVRIKPNRFTDQTNDIEWYESPQLIEEINQFSKDVLDVKLAGGEPTLNKSLLAFMQGLVDSGKSKQVELSISTNFTTGNRNLYKILSAFKRIRLFISIDGYGAMNDYLRFPSKWSTIEKNVHYLQDLRSQMPVEIAIAPVLNIYNALTITELFTWADQLGYGNVADVVRGVDHIDCLLLPRITRDKAIQNLMAYSQQIEQPYKKSVIQTLCDKLDAELPNAKLQKGIRDFVQFTHYIDTSRHLSFPDVAPETFADMVTCYGAEMDLLQTNRQGAIPVQALHD